MFHAHAPTFAIGRTVRRGLVTALAVLAMCVPAGLAQTPESDATPAGGAADAYLAEIHRGTCAELGEVVVTLENVTPEVGEDVGAASAFPVKTSHNSGVPVSLDEILASSHAVDVHRSDAEMGTSIACGDIGGVLSVQEDRSHLLIGLGEQNDSGYSGTAWIGSDGDTIEVAITLIEPDKID